MDVNLVVNYMDLVPWHFRLLVHTMKVVKSDGSNVEISFMNYVPSQDRVRPSTLQLEFTVPALETMEISIKIRKVLLKWTEHPPDPHHGHSCGPSLVYVDVGNTTHRVYSEPLLIQLMVPDFSMPYNVLCLSCTIMTIGYSAAQALATKRYMFVMKKTLKDKLNIKIDSLKAKLLSVIKKAKTTKTE